MHPKNRTRYKGLDPLAADPRILEVWDEDEDGLWASLTTGYNNEGASTIHEYSVRDLLAAMKYITPGDTY